MAKARALYICPVTEAAIVAAAPVIAAGRDYEVVKAILMHGFVDPNDPTPNEESYVVRPGRCISQFLRGRNIEVTPVAAPPFDVAGWRTRIGDALTADLLEGVDEIVVNAQAGTKQMSYGAWEGLTEKGSAGANLAIVKSFVVSGAVTKVQLDSPPATSVELAVEPLATGQYLELYGFQECGAGRATGFENWFWQRRNQIMQLWNAKRDTDNKAYGIVRRLARDADGQLGNENYWHASLWLEAGLYVLLKERARASVVPTEITASLKLFNWASRNDRPLAEAGPLAPDHEVDAAVLARGVLHLFECKNDKRGLTPEMVSKQGDLRDRLQGRGGVNAIVTPSRYLPAAESSLWFKARDRNVQIVAPGDVEFDACLSRIFGLPPAP